MTDDQRTEASQDEAAAGKATAKARWRRYRSTLARNALLVALLLEITLFYLLSADFLTLNNFLDIGVQSSIIGLVAVTSAILLLTGYVDLSIGSTLALAAVVTGLLLSSGSYWALAILAGLGVGLAVGVLNGVLVCLLGFSAIIVTLGMLTAIRGAAIAVSDQTPSGFGSAFAQLGNGSILGIPVPILIVGTAFALGGLFLRYSVYGRHVYAIGVNREAAFLSGIAIRKIPFVIFALTGMSAALGGIILASRIDAAPASTIGNGLELDVLTAVLLGGVAFGGGRGSIFGVLLGVLFLAILQNGLTLLNVPSTYALIAKGSVLVAAAAFEYINSRSA